MRRSRPPLRIRTDKLEPYAALWTIEDQLIQNLRLWVLRECNWNRSQAADVLGIARRTMRNAVAQYRARGIEIPQNTEERHRQDLRIGFYVDLSRVVHLKGRIHSKEEETC